MKTIIAGSRTIFDFKVLKAGLRLFEREQPEPISEVVCGTAIGIDSLGRTWARSQGIPVKEFPANWDLYGKRAGYLRNAQMAEYADALLAIWDGSSKGTRHMIDLAKSKNLYVVTYNVNTTLSRCPVDAA
jgi:hypothetical protein